MNILQSTLFKISKDFNIAVSIKQKILYATLVYFVLLFGIILLFTPNACIFFIKGSYNESNDNKI